MIGTKKGQIARQVAIYCYACPQMVLGTFFSTEKKLLANLLLLDPEFGLGRTTGQDG
ncbi:MAG: hypothetical protein KAR05_11900 [Candidatus Omnitrophica bacterium]|nr:hypothetical protein [Candidatus Omnitrophota bacterium]